MCGILVTRSISSVKKYHDSLVERGTVAWSLASIDLSNLAYINTPYILKSNKNDKLDLTKELEAIVEFDGLIYVLHVQSPTSITHNTHPAENSGRYLWHNGMIDSAAAERLNVRDIWDTQYLLDEIVPLTPDFSADKLNAFEGSFACVYYSGLAVYLFRNRISPFFYNKDEGVISSIKHNKLFEKVEPNIIFKVGEDVTLTPVKEFNNTFNPFGV